MKDSDCVIILMNDEGHQVVIEADNPAIAIWKEKGYLEVRDEMEEKTYTGIILPGYEKSVKCDVDRDSVTIGIKNNTAMEGENDSGNVMDGQVDLSSIVNEN